MKKNLFLLMIGMTSMVNPLQANESDLLSESQDSLSFEQMDIDGNQKKESKSDKVAKAVEKLKENINDAIDTKVEEKRLANEQKLGNELMSMFNGESTDQVSNVQSSTVVAVAPKEEAKKSFRVIPQIGILNIRGENLTIESDINTGIAVESDLNEHFAMGGAFQYASMKITDLGSFGGFNQFYSYGYFQNFGQTGRELVYDHMGLEIYSKYYFIKNSKFRPFVGLGLGLNRMKLEYVTRNASSPYYYSGNSVGNEQYQSTYAAGTIMAGALVNFTESVGLNADFRMSRGLTSQMNAQAANQGFFNPDQERLNRIGDSIGSANFFSLNMGLVIAF